MIHSAVRIIGSVHDDRLVTGERREPVGTGFLVTVPSETIEGLRYGYVLTAHHILFDQDRVEVQAPDPTANGALNPPVTIEDWRQPLKNADLALAPFHEGNRSDRMFQALQIETDVLPIDKQAGLGTPIYYIGILTPLDRPMARSGTIGAVEETGIRHAEGYDYPAHLVDCRSYGGFSGSPCFVQETFAGLAPVAVEGFQQPVGRMYFRVRLCGMFTQHLTDSDAAVSRYGVGSHAAFAGDMGSVDEGRDAKRASVLGRNESKRRRRRPMKPPRYIPFKVRNNWRIDIKHATR
jgi:hypothetical protein